MPSASSGTSQALQNYAPRVWPTRGAVYLMHTVPSLFRGSGMSDHSIASICYRQNNYGSLSNESETFMGSVAPSVPGYILRCTISEAMWCFSAECYGSDNFVTRRRNKPKINRSKLNHGIFVRFLHKTVSDAWFTLVDINVWVYNRFLLSISV